MRSLQSTGVPLPFTCYYAAEVEDASKIEKALHAGYADSRVNPNREFFNISPEAARAILKEFEITDQTVGEQFENEDEKWKMKDEKEKSKMKVKMKIKNINLGKSKISLISIFFYLLTINTVQTDDLDYFGKKIDIRILDKLSSKSKLLKLDVGENFSYKNLEIKVLKCKNSKFDDKLDIVGNISIGEDNSDLLTINSTINIPGGTTGQSLVKGADGNITYSTVSSGGSSLTIKNAGTSLTNDATSIDFTGGGVTASGTSDANKTVNIPGSSLTLQNAGSTLSTNTTVMNFTGAGVTALGDTATKTIDIPGVPFAVNDISISPDDVSIIPIPPASHTADASWLLAIQPIGAWIIGYLDPVWAATLFIK